MPPLSHRPFYRTILQDAWHTAWRARALWLVAVAAGILQTGGIIDVLVRLMREHLGNVSSLGQISLLPGWSEIMQIINVGSSLFARAIISLKLVQVSLLAIVFGITVLVLSILCQAALVYVIGARGRFTRPTLQEAFAVAGDCFWKVAAINLLPIGAYIGGWFVFLAPFGRVIPLTSVGVIVAYLLAIILALAISFLATALHLLALQRVVLDAAPLKAALTEAWMIMRQSWFVILETAFGMFVLGVALFLASVAAIFVLLLPVFALVGFAIVFQASVLTNLLLQLSEFLFAVALLTVGGFMITFQYTIWNRLFSRLSKGMAVAKVVRLVHQALAQIPSFRTRT